MVGEEQLTEVSGPLPAEAVSGGAAVEAAKNGLEYRRRDDGKTWVLVRASAGWCWKSVPEPRAIRP